MQSFWMNNRRWYVVRVEPDNSALIDRTGRRTVATTNPQSSLICISSELHGDDLARVTVHEMAHAAMVSFGLLDEIHAFTPPENWIQAEEWACNFMADYGMTIFRAAYALIGADAWQILPFEMSKLAN